ncbi:MAG: serine hydrolase domain-containing protein [Cyclobacteriaceae bacterium]
MTRKYLMTLLALIALVSCHPAKQTSERSISKNLDSLFNNAGDFSGVVLIAENGIPIYHKAFGYKNFETKIQLDTTDIFELASVSKQFTSMIIMILQEQGLLDYDDAIAKYIPGLPYHGITIRHLLNHTSGLPDYQAIMDQNWDKSKVAGNEENIEYLKKYHPKEYFMPGEKITEHFPIMVLDGPCQNIPGLEERSTIRETTRDSRPLSCVTPMSTKLLFFSATTGMKSLMISLSK